MYFTYLVKDLTIGEYAVDGVRAMIEDPSIDPLMQENFQLMFTKAYNRVQKDTTQNKNRLGTVSKLFSKTVILNTRNKLKLEKLS